MSSLEWWVFITLNSCFPMAYFFVPTLWEKANNANTSFMSEFYYFPIVLLVVGCCFGIAFWWGLIEHAIKKVKNV